uniref:Uncharacterized protein n=1 Tax=Caenorhabditis japonica TaxID=281687 RepID=A0A8R1EUF9_CAEJA
MPNAMIPLFWQESSPDLAQFIYNEVWFGFVLIPRLMQVLQFIALGLGLGLIVILVFLQFRRRKVSSQKIVANGTSEPN